MVDVYDPETDTWSDLPDMPTPRDHLGVAVVDGVLYAVGGRQAAFETEITTTEALDLKTSTWRTGLAPIPTPRGGFATAAVDGRIVTIGGESAAGVHDQVEAYDPETNSWTTLAPMPLARHGIQGAAYAGGAWIAGGGTDLNVAATNAIDVFFPPPRPAPAPSPSSPAASPPRPRSAPSLKILRGRAAAPAASCWRCDRPAATVVVVRSRGRVIGRLPVPGGERRVVVRLRRALPKGRLVVRAAGLVRRARVR